MSLPSIFLERLRKIIPNEHLAQVLQTFDLKRNASVRVNRLKTTSEEFQNYLRDGGVQFDSPLWSSEAFVLTDLESSEVSKWDWHNQGKIYIQSLSSMLPAIVLNPQPYETILDLCAAPGSKTSQMAALMSNQGKIVALDVIRERFYRMKSVLELLGVTMVETKCLDGRKYRPYALNAHRDQSPINSQKDSTQGMFDRILLDAPCSSEGRFKTYDKKTIGYWSLRKIKEMVHKQRGLLLNAMRLLKPDGVLVYSTCTFAPEENEGVIDWILRKMPNEIVLEPIVIEGCCTYPALQQWENKSWNPIVEHCCRILPTPMTEGFFMAQLRRRIT